MQCKSDSVNTLRMCRRMLHMCVQRYASNCLCLCLRDTQRCAVMQLDMREMLPAKATTLHLSLSLPVPLPLASCHCGRVLKVTRTHARMLQLPLGLHGEVNSCHMPCAQRKLQQCGAATAAACAARKSERATR